MNVRFAAIMAILLGGSLAWAGPVEDPPAKKVIRGEEYRLEIQSVPAAEQKKWDKIYQIDEGGQIFLPFVGKVRVAGKTPRQAEKAIEKSLRSHEIYTSPRIQLSLVIPKG